PEHVAIELERAIHVTDEDPSVIDAEWSRRSHLIEAPRILRATALDTLIKARSRNSSLPDVGSRRQRTDGIRGGKDGWKVVRRACGGDGHARGRSGGSRGLDVDGRSEEDVSRRRLREDPEGDRRG